MRKIIINADDLGLTAGINKAIANSYVAGRISCASIMATGPRFLYACELAKRYHIPVGVHVTFPDARSRLIHPIIEPKTIDVKYLIREVMAQIRVVIDSGLVPKHWDSHKFLLPGKLYSRVVETVQDKCSLRFVGFAKGKLSEKADAISIHGSGSIMPRGRFSFASMDLFLKETKKLESVRTWVHMAVPGGHPAMVEAYGRIMSRQFLETLKANDCEVARNV